ncbi:tetratricopeptide repeat protein [Streptomyces lutosisoli]|uniref:Tetratricopeptide repeat protein n=1 Tax=Streptomyces lutosisoli TaxID=2665721 RepID=A0ABW2W1Y9_9ACTN
MLKRPRPAVGPLRDLKDLLYEAYLAAGHPSLDEIAGDIAEAEAEDCAVTGAPSRDTIHRCISSTSLPPNQADAVSVAVVLARRAAWDEADLAARTRELWIRAWLAVQPGEPVTEFADPFALEVHRAIEVESSDTDALPLLPAYVERDHDARLRAAVLEAVAGRSRLVMLVGDSSTGKTRACWEALRLLPAQWRLWHPIDPTRPEAALAELERVGPRTVVWLNEAQHYLLTANRDLGQRVAAGLRALLREPPRGPVLVLGTIWPEYWDILLREPAGGSEDPHEQARKLLASNDLSLPTSFTGTDLRALELKARDDPRLAYATERAEEGQITQYLAGAPALLERYRTAPKPTRAVIEAAMDTRRLGHSLALPLPLLEAAAEGYLTGAQWDLLPDDWLDKALAGAVGPLRGARGPLTRIRPHKGDAASAQPRYRLADYLEQHARTHRLTVRIPASLWSALLDYASPPDCTVLAEAARTRGLLHIAGQFYQAAAAAGDARAAERMGDLLENAGRGEEANGWYLYAAELCDGDAAPESMGNLLLLAGRGEEAVSWYERAVRESPYWEDGEDQSPIGMRLLHAGWPGLALPWIQRGAEAGDREAWRYAAGVLHEEGRVEEEISWAKKAAESGVAGFFREAVALLDRADRSDETIAWILDCVQAGASEAYPYAVSLPRQKHDKERALALLQERATAGDMRALGPVADALTAAGRPAEALTAYRRAAEAGDRTAKRMVVRLLRSTGRTDEAVRWLQSRAEDGDRDAPQYLGDVLMQLGREEEALDVWYQRAADVEYVRLFGMYHAAADTLLRAGRPDDALAWLQARAEAGHKDAFNQMIQLLRRLDREDEAIRHLRAKADSGDNSASLSLLQLLQETGRVDEQLDWYKRSADTGSTLSMAVALSTAGQIEEALACYERAVQEEYFVRRSAAEMLAKAYGPEAAMSWLQRHAYVGGGVLQEAADVLKVAGRGRESVNVLRYGWDPDGSIAAEWHVNHQTR